MSTSSETGSTQTVTAGPSLVCDICQTGVYALNVVSNAEDERGFRLVCAGCVDIAALGNGNAKVRRSKS